VAAIAAAAAAAIAGFGGRESLLLPFLLPALLRLLFLSPLFVVVGVGVGAFLVDGERGVAWLCCINCGEGEGEGGRERWSEAEIGLEKNFASKF